MPPQVNFFTALINAGIPPSSAQELEAAFATEADFLDGLEQVSTFVALKQSPSALPPTGEPWKAIYIAMVDDISQRSADVITAFSNALNGYPPDLQLSITGAVNIRMKAILDFEAQKGSKKRFKTKDYLKALKNLGYKFALNECTDTIELNSVPINDQVAAQIRCKMRDAGFLQSNEFEDAYISDAWHNRYHPIKKYLGSLQYDGGEHIKHLADHFQDKYQTFPLWLRKWLIGCIAKVFDNEQNPMLVLDGPQGIGKSQFVKWLSSPLNAYFIEGPINTDDKDTVIRLYSKWIWEVSELGATTRKADYEALKAFLSTREVTVRKPYGRFDIHKPALASFVGTVNNSAGILADPTGNRRFLICKLEKIDWSYSVSIDAGQVWAEAMVAYLAHEPWKLTNGEQTQANQINEEYEVEDIIEGILKKTVMVDPDRKDWWMPTADILAILENPYQGNLKGTSKGNAMALAATMMRIGCDKCKSKNTMGQRVWGYTGVQVGP